MWLVLVTVEEVEILFVNGDFSTRCRMVEVGTRCVWFSIGMNFAIGTNGDGHFDHTIKDLIGLVWIDKVVGNRQDGIVSDHNPGTIHDHTAGKFGTNKDNITTDGAGHVDFSKIGAITTDITEVRTSDRWFVQNALRPF